jgi:hypothetical protein
MFRRIQLGGLDETGHERLQGGDVVRLPGIPGEQPVAGGIGLELGRP